MPIRYQNSQKAHDRVPSYYVNNRIYPGAYTRNEWQTRASRRVHDGINIDRNYGLDTVSDDVNSSPYSSPYYINGRYHTMESISQRGSSSSVQGMKRLISVGDELEDFTDDDIKTSIELWQGKQIKFKMPYSGRIVGNTISLKNTGGCTGILSIYVSASENGLPLYETAIDLCKVSMDVFEHFKLYSVTTIPITANPKGEVYVRMEIWDEISQERSANPFNTGRKIEIAATGLSGHKECIYTLGEKNVPVKEEYIYSPQPNRPCLAFIYNNCESIPVNRIEESDHGASVSKDGYRYDIFCYRLPNRTAKLIIYDKEMNKVITEDDAGNPISLIVDGRATAVNLVQTEDNIQYVDGYSPLRKFKIGEWGTLSSGERRAYEYPTSTADEVTTSIDLATWQTSPLGTNAGTYQFEYSGADWTYDGQIIDLATYGITVTGSIVAGGIIEVEYLNPQGTSDDISVKYTDGRPVIAASIICKHHNRVYLGGFRYDPNLVQCSEIKAEGPDYSSFIYRFYVPDNSPLSTSTSPVTAMVQYTADTLMIVSRNSCSLFTTNTKATGTLESGVPQQVSTFTDGSGVASAGDVVNYAGVVYSFDQDEGIRRYNGALWNEIPNSINSHVERVDMTKPRKLWGYAHKLYFNYTDSADGKAKCLIWDQDMNYQQFPWFQDSDIPFCDVRYDDNFDLVGIHPDYPCIMQLYAKDTWRRLDSPINFERHTKYVSLPGNAADMVLKRVHNKVLANANRWWYFSITADTDNLYQTRGKDHWYRLPCWDTIMLNESPESPFPNQDEYESNALARLTLTNLRMRGLSVQEKIKCKTFREQACLVSTLFEAQPRQYN